MADEFEEIQIEQAWIGAEELPLHFANSFLATWGPNAFFVGIGSQFPPDVESEEEFERIKERGYHPIRPIARFALAPSGLDDLIEVLETVRSNYQEFLRSKEDEQP